MRKILISILLFCNVQSCLAEVDVLAVAKSVSDQKYKGWTYGNSSEKKQINCVQFLLSVLQRCLGRDLSPDEIKMVSIDYEFADLGKSVEERDPRTWGVQRAIVDSLKCGNKVEISDVRPGDFIQYWIKPKRGPWFGHAAVVSQVHRENNGQVSVTIYGAHKSENRISDSGYKLKLSGDKRYFYIARMTP